MDNTIKSVIRDAIAISVIASSITRLIDAIVEHANVCDEKMSDTVRKMLITGSAVMCG